ncbi:transcriptional repressor of sporulation and degradative enzyme production [Alkalihalophilus pseudofirmus OF4]|uniref:Transcriptional repressor of sporulation and degradative enzyme production n=1 Tax=Alkalihalophilus pseudofirmus (strain ATCC BAA-2126 / JCM 17055 / OF4) TaxID=398511 RepID=D3FS72_ALKPO|nr:MULTISPECIES: FMN-binding negative transcriptional regulator [Alkalihalophilus]ADC51707.1 transcriptional repressor of sporulation and degradative enzyme production [Alkalihalophilus pseudofirmus OF4]MED1600381.1 FMN-binding negative transcriptional regulator [Alkalihalophilus marmarensis]
MYIPKAFKLNDQAVIEKIINENGFATLFSQHKGRPAATHLPLILDRERHYLYGHFARPNSQWKDIEGQTVLMVFQGPHSYISPTWYETETAVPTWNYLSVHVYGSVELIDDEKSTLASLCELIEKYEGPDSTYNLNEVDADYIAGLTKGIQAFRIRITEMEGKAKLSQNHPTERQERVAEQLAKSEHTNDKLIAEWMTAQSKNND